MRITHTRFGTAVFFGLAGRLTFNGEFEDLRAATAEISSATRGVFVDLGDVTRLDCWGVGQLIRLRYRVGALGRTFGLVNVERNQRRLLELLGVTVSCRIYPNRGEALRSLATCTPTGPQTVRIAAPGRGVRGPGSRLESADILTTTVQR